MRPDGPARPVVGLPAMATTTAAPSKLHQRRVRRPRRRTDRAGPQPGDRRGDRPRPAVDRRGRRPRGQGGSGRVRRAGPGRPPASGRWPCSGSPTLIEEHADELAELESDNAGKPLAAFRDDEIPFMVDNLRFFAGAARCLHGRAAGEYIERLHVDDPPRADRRDRADRAVELPADDGRVEDRPGAGGRATRSCSSPPRRRR